MTAAYYHATLINAHKALINNEYYQKERQVA